MADNINISTDQDVSENIKYSEEEYVNSATGDGLSNSCADEMIAMGLPLFFTSKSDTNNKRTNSNETGVKRRSVLFQLVMMHIKLKSYIKAVKIQMMNYQHQIGLKRVSP